MEQPRYRDRALSTAIGRGDGLDGDDVPQTDNLDVFGKRVVRLGSERVEAQSGYETQAGILNLKRTSVGKSKAEWDERLPFQFLGQRFRIHT